MTIGTVSCTNSIIMPKKRRQHNHNYNYNHQQQQQQQQLRNRLQLCSTINWLLLVVVLLLLCYVDYNRIIILQIPVVTSFAYAPNFISKIIEKQTLLTPNEQYILPKSAIVSSSSPSFTGTTTTTTTTTTTVHVEEDDDDDIDDSILSQLQLQLQLQNNQNTIIKTRFPPEPNGYLHLGHAKAISFNFAVARAFNGLCHIRMDDTNPSKESIEYVNSIIEDVIWIQSGLSPTTVLLDDTKTNNINVPWYGPVHKTSNYFQLLYDCAIELIKSGDAYVDSLTADEMKVYRGTLTSPGIDSPYRSRTVEENLQLFLDMKNGQYQDGTHVLRAKIDMSSSNINMRDPTLYRIKHEVHQETSNDWCIYPMYDYSHPISDSIEGITHSLCTLEFEDHKPFYNWILQKLIPTRLINVQSQQIEFSRLNIQSTILSKRKLIQLVTENHVTNWDDPRMPTICGLRRRGVPASAIRLFCERIGISKSDSFINYNVFETCIRDSMDEQCTRSFCVLHPLKVTIVNLHENEKEIFTVDNHPKNTTMGTRDVLFTNSIYIERDDFFDVTGPEGIANNGKVPKGYKRLVINNKVRLRYAYVIECINVIRDTVTNEPIELQCNYYKETRAGVTPTGFDRVNGIIHWVNTASAVPVTINLYDRLFLVDEPGSTGDGNFLNDINLNSLQIIHNAYVEQSVGTDVSTMLSKIEKATNNSHNQDNKEHKVDLNTLCNKIYPSELSYQFERNGYFALDTTSTKDTIVFNRVVTLRDTWGDTTTSSSTGTSATTKSDKPASQQQPRQSNTDSSNNEPIEDIRRIAFRAATIVSVQQHPESDKLVICTVDCGDSNNDDDNSSEQQLRTVVAGIGGKIVPIDTLIGRKVVAVTNLKPAKVRGIESTAMLLAASSSSSSIENNESIDNDTVQEEEIIDLLTVPESVPNGELLTIEGYDISVPDTMLKSKGAIKAWERVKASLRTNDIGEVIYFTCTKTKIDDDDSTSSSSSTTSTDGIIASSNRLLSSAGPIVVITKSLINSIIQ